MNANFFLRNAVSDGLNWMSTHTEDNRLFSISKPTMTLHQHSQAFLVSFNQYFFLKEKLQFTEIKKKTTVLKNNTDNVKKTPKGLWFLPLTTVLQN